MDRLYRTLAGSGLTLALLLTHTGCRSTRPEVPPRQSFSANGQPPPVGFGSEANPANGLSGLPGVPGSGQYGTPGPSSGPVGAGSYAPTANSYGPPGSSPLANPPASSAANPATIVPQAGTGPIAPVSPSAKEEDPSKTVPSPNPFQPFPQ